MTMNDQVNDTPESRAGSTPIDEGRRRLAKAGLGAGTLIVTMASRSALGAVCQSPSGFTSGNLSQQGTPPLCNGRTPGYWKEKNSYGFDCTHPAGDWSTAGRCPGVCDDPNKCNDWTQWHDTVTYVAHKFKDDFNCTGNLKHLKSYKPANSWTYKDYSLMQVMHLDGNKDPYQLGGHLCAALLNALSGKNAYPNADQVRRIAYEYDTMGYYEPVANVKWYAEDIVQYLQSTMD